MTATRVVTVAVSVMVCVGITCDQRTELMIVQGKLTDQRYASHLVLQRAIENTNETFAGEDDVTLINLYVQWLFHLPSTFGGNFAYQGPKLKCFLKVKDDLS